jgi:uncharacterized membrane protein YphA (DoxX/SURF4 family)
VVRLPTKALDGFGTLVRLGLAAVWLVSGAVKAADPNQTLAAVRAYKLLSTGLATPIAAAVPYLELAFGVLVLLGIGTRLMAVLSGLLLLVYIGAILQSWARGLSIDCGCFGGGGQVAAGQTHYLRETLVDVGFLALAVWLAVRPWTYLSVDRLLGRSAPTDDEDETDEPDDAGDGSDGSSNGPAPSAVGRA